MTETREQTMQIFIDAWNRRDLDAVLTRTREDFEYVNAPNSVEPGTRSGTEGIEMVMKKQWEALGADALREVTRVHHRDACLLTEGSVSRSMPGSTTRLENKTLLRWTFEGERLVRLEVLGAGTTYAGALEAAGIPKGQ